MSEKGFDHREDAVKLGIRVKSLYKNVIHTYIGICRYNSKHISKKLFRFQLLSSNNKPDAIASTSVEDTNVFEDRSDILYQLPQALRNSELNFSGNILNMDIVNECTPIAALKLGEDMRRLILALYAKFLSSDGRTVDYDGIKR